MQSQISSKVCRDLIDSRPVEFHYIRHDYSIGKPMMCVVDLHRSTKQQDPLSFAPRPLQEDVQGSAWPLDLSGMLWLLQSAVKSATASRVWHSTM